MIQDAARSSVQSARSTTIAGSATAVIISSRPERNAPIPRTASSTVATPRPIARECRSGARRDPTCARRDRTPALRRNAAGVSPRATRCPAASARAPRSRLPNQEEAAIEAEVAVRMAGVTRRFNDTVAVDAIDMVIPTGSVVGVIGPSGSGKTTTIRMITGSLGPTEGKVEVLGENPKPLHAPHARADRLHAAALQPLPGPHRHRERRLRRGPLRAGHVPALAPAQGGPASSWTCGRFGGGVRASSPAA